MNHRQFSILGVLGPSSFSSPGWQYCNLLNIVSNVVITYSIVLLNGHWPPNLAMIIVSVIVIACAATYVFNQIIHRRGRKYNRISNTSNDICHGEVFSSMLKFLFYYCNHSLQVSLGGVCFHSITELLSNNCGTCHVTSISFYTYLFTCGYIFVWVVLMYDHCIVYTYFILCTHDQR